MSGQANVEKRYDTLYNDVKGFFENSTSGKMNAASVTTLVRYSMEVVQTGKLWTGMHGSEKKDLVIGVVTALVNDLLDDPSVVGEDFSDDTRQAILAALSFAPMLIDAAVDFAKAYASGDGSGGSRLKCCF